MVHTFFFFTLYCYVKFILFLSLSFYLCSVFMVRIVYVFLYDVTILVTEEVIVNWPDLLVED